MLELKTDCTAEVAAAQLTRDRLRSTEAAKAEAETRAAVHAAAEQALGAQVQQLQAALAEAHDMLAHRSKLAPSGGVLQPLAGGEGV